MSAESKTTSQTTTPDSERFVQIPQARPGQKYRAPKNFSQPFASGFYRLAVVVLCLSLPLAPGAIFAMILFTSNAVQDGFLWLWIPMIVLVEAIAILVAWGVAREALGSSGEAYIAAKR